MSASQEARTLGELALLARRRLAPDVWDYLVGGAESETTQWRNRSALDGYAFRPRVLRDVSSIDARIQLFGRTHDLPMFLAPVGSLVLFDKSAALACARAAERAAVPLFMSIMAAPSIEEVASAAPDLTLILQLYIRGDRHWLDKMVARAEAAGCCGLCLTVDTPVYGRRERDLQNRFSSAAAADRVNLGDHRTEQITVEQAALTWKDVAYLRSRTKMPLIIKGIATPEDASLAVDHGVDAVYLSNHGGRQLDHAGAVLDQLGEIRTRTPATCAILVDGGFLRGTDVAKAIALGATAAGFGKLQGLALAAGGAQGVTRMLELLRDEYLTALALLGCASTSDLSRDHVYACSPLYETGTLARDTLTRALGLIDK